MESTMAITGAKYSFNDTNVNNAPDKAGVYALYEGDILIYYGRAQGGDVTIRSRLQSHLRGDEGSCTKAASSFNSEASSSPVAREKELLAEFEKQNSRLPRCNSRVG